MALSKRLSDPKEIGVTLGDMTYEPDASRPLKHVESTVAWILGRLSAEDLAQFESELPQWASGATVTDVDADTAVRELRDWLGRWIDRAKE